MLAHGGTPPICWTIRSHAAQCALIAALCLLAACGRAPWRLPADAVTFPRGAIMVALPAEHPVRAVALLDPAGRVLLEQPVPQGTVLVPRFDYAWALDEHLTLRVDLADGSSVTLPLTAPAVLPPPVEVGLQLPEGVDLALDGAPLLLPAGAEGALAVTLRNDGGGPWSGVLAVRASTSALSASPLLRFGLTEHDSPEFRESVTLPLPGESRSVRIPFRTGDAPGQVLLAWEVRAAAPDAGAARWGGSRAVTVEDAPSITAGLSIADSAFPADALGISQAQRPADTLMLAPALPGWAGGTPRDPYVPVAHARLVLASRLSGTVATVVRTWVEPEPGGLPLTAFGNPLLAGGGAVGVALARIPAQGEAVIAQPLYLRGAEPGRYRRCAQLLPWGADAGQRPVCRPLEVRASPLWDWIALWGLTLAAVAGFALALWRAPRWLERFALRDQVLAALTFGLAFVASSLPFLLVSAVAAAVLGPFLFLVEGLFYKGVLFIVLGSLFAVLPRPGVYLLFYTLWMAAQALLSGYYAYGPVTLLFAGVAVTCMEAALWVSGLTRSGAAQRAGILWPALLIGVAEAVIVYWDLLLLRALYRQYFAQWYLLLEAASAGCYAALGVAAGLGLGRALRPMRRPAPARLSASPAPAPPEPLPGAPLLEIDGLTYTYPGAAAPALQNLSLTVQPGEIVLLGGATGSGKTTLLRLIQGLLPLPQPAAVRLAGVPRGAFAAPDWAACCALLFQEPALQIVRPTVAEEIALGLQLAGRPAGGGSVAQELARQGLSPLADRAPAHLSGGELQRVALAALLAGGPRLLLLDEPLAHLDGAARAQLPARLAALAQTGLAVLAVEHRLEPLLPLARRVLWLEHGRIAWEGPPAAFQAWMGAARPSEPLPSPPTGRPPVLRLREVSFRHAAAPAPVFSGLTADVLPGQALALCGPNGAGKSTLLELLLGLRRPAAGTVTLEGVPVHRLGWGTRSRVFGYLPQRADLLLHAPTVEEELALALRWRGWTPAAAAERAAAWRERLGLSHAAGRFPHLLSRGERQRLALGAILISEPRVLLLDEPFVGQDEAQAARLVELCREFLAADPERCLLVATHDLDPWGDTFPVHWHLAEGRLKVTAVPMATGHAPRRAVGGAR